MVHVNESCNQSISLFTHNLIKSGSLEHHVGINHGWSIYIKNIWSNECQVLFGSGAKRTKRVEILKRLNS
ncbi:hypothetical protein BLOT_000008 [Blomia tropicalis]|nr:hypothetical protein BLOT_000008 [Blomia tropicalis]